MKTMLITIIVLFTLVACSAPPNAGDPVACAKACDVDRITCENVAANACAHCCEPQPYVDETKDGTLFTRPISACSSTPLPSTWSVEWCMSDCEAAGASSCAPAFDSCNAGCQ